MAVSRVKGPGKRGFKPQSWRDYRGLYINQFRSELRPDDREFVDIETTNGSLYRAKSMKEATAFIDGYLAAKKEGLE